jgi:hypothetical protein
MPRRALSVRRESTLGEAVGVAVDLVDDAHAHARALVGRCRPSLLDGSLVLNNDLGSEQCLPYGELTRQVKSVHVPGLTFIIPIIDVLRRVSLWTVTMPIQSQGMITRDNVSIDVSAVAYYRVVDATKSVAATETVAAAPIPRSGRWRRSRRQLAADGGSVRPPPSARASPRR